MTRVDESEQGRFFLLTQKLDFDLEMGKLFSRDSFAKNDGIFINWSGNLFEKLFCDISLSRQGMEKLGAKFNEDLSVKMF